MADDDEVNTIQIQTEIWHAKTKSCGRVRSETENMT